MKCTFTYSPRRVKVQCNSKKPSSTARIPNLNLVSSTFVCFTYVILELFLNFSVPQLLYVKDMKKRSKNDKVYIIVCRIQGLVRENV